MDFEKEPLQPAQDNTLQDTMTILNSYKEMLFNTGNFFKQYIDTEKPFSFAYFIAVFLLNCGIVRVDRMYSKLSAAENASLGFLNNWPAYFILVFIAAVIAGALSYLIVATFYYLRIKWSGGKAGFSKAGKLAVYTAAIPNVVTVLLTAVTVIYYDKPFDSVSLINPFLDNSIFFISTASVYVSIYISYKAVRAVTDVEHKKSKFWFLILPSVITTAFFGSLYFISRG